VATQATPTIPADPGVLDDLRELVLARAEEMSKALGPAPGFLPRIDAELYERRLAGDSSVPATLAKLFLLAVAVPLDEAARALTPLRPDALVETGLAALNDDVIRPLARVGTQAGVVVASDVLRNHVPPDFVTGLSPAATRVDRLTIRRPVRGALDLGTGPGIQALLAASHCERVVAVDVNERALAFTRLNARLNGLSNIDVRRGSWFEPVDGELFDLIVANPPYVVSPDSELLYRDGDLLADAVTQKLLQEAPAHLEEGGFAHVMGNWIHSADEDWRAPVERWLAGSGCDALLLRYGGAGDLVSYAADWNLLLAEEGQQPFLEAVDRWLDYYRAEGIEAICDGMVLLRRRSGAGNWVRAIEVPSEPTGAAGDHLLRLFEARDRRGELDDDDAVLAARFDRVPGLKLSRRAEGPGLADKQAKVGLEQGIGFAVSVPPAIAELLGSLDGVSRLDELVSEDRQAVAAMRRLFALGLVSAGHSA